MDSTHIFSKLPIKRKTPEPDPNPPPFKYHRIWTEPDEIRFLQGLLHHASSDNLFYPRDLNVFYARFSSTMSQPYTKSQLSEKLRRLRKKFRVVSSRLVKGLDVSMLSPHDRALYDLSKRLWHPDFASTSPFGCAVDKKSNLVGVKVKFLPTFHSGSNSGRVRVSGNDDNGDGNGEIMAKANFLPTISSVSASGPDHDPTLPIMGHEDNDGDTEIGVKSSFLPNILSGCDPTRDRVLVNDCNGGIGVKANFLPNSASVLGPGWAPDQDPTHDGSVKNDKNDGNSEIKVKASFLSITSSAQGPCSDWDHDLTHDGFSVNDGNSENFPIISSVSGPGADHDPKQDLTHDAFSVNDEDDYGTGVTRIKASSLLSISSVLGQGPGQEPTRDGFTVNNEKNDDGKLSEVNVELDRGDIGGKPVGSSCLDGPVKVGVGFSGGVEETAAKVVMDVFDECLKDIRNGVVGEKSNVDDFWKEVDFEERWKEQRVAELDVLARRARLVLEHSLQS